MITALSLRCQYYHQLQLQEYSLLSLRSHHLTISQVSSEALDIRNHNHPKKSVILKTNAKHSEIFQATDTVFSEVENKFILISLLLRCEGLSIWSVNRL